VDVLTSLADVDWPTVAASVVTGLVSVILTNWLAWSRFRRAYRLDDRTEAVLRRLLKDRRFNRRKFETIQAFVPLPDDKLREALLRSGAVRLPASDGQEYWGLLENHLGRVFPKSTSRPG